MCVQASILTRVWVRITRSCGKVDARWAKDHPLISAVRCWGWEISPRQPSNMNFIELLYFPEQRYVGTHSTSLATFSYRPTTFVINAMLYLVCYLMVLQTGATRLIRYSGNSTSTANSLRQNDVD
jgi:hypothetical protein